MKLIAVESWRIQSILWIRLRDHMTARDLKKLEQYMMNRGFLDYFLDPESMDVQIHQSRLHGKLRDSLSSI